MSTQTNLRTRIKICGITRPEDGVAAARLGVDAIGLNFYEPSPRAVDLERAARIAAALPPFVTRVGLFVNAPAERIEQALHVVGLDLLQFHGDESRSDCEKYGRPYVKTVSVRAGADVVQIIEQYASASGILLDTWHKHLRGGSGKTFDWSLIPRTTKVPLILAGGLTAENVAAAIATARPYAVDVSGGVEAAKGIKDVAKMSAFIEEVNSVTTAR